MDANDEPHYDYEQYQKALSIILEQASKEYWSHNIDINRHQIMVGRTYLWVSAALLGSYFTSYNLAQNISGGLVTSCFILFAGIAIALAAIAFGFCLYALPGRKGYLKIGTSWRAFAGNAYRSLESESNSIYSETLTELIESFDLGIEHGSQTNSTRATMLRWTSWLLLSSFCAAILATLIYLIEKSTS